MHSLDIFDWAIAEMNVPVYPQDKVFKKAAAIICEIGEGPQESGVRLNITPQQAWFYRKGTQNFSCGEILKL